MLGRLWWESSIVKLHKSVLPARYYRLRILLQPQHRRYSGGEHDNFELYNINGILLYKGEYIPVGEDQLQHLELTRIITRKFTDNSIAFL